MKSLFLLALGLASTAHAETPAYCAAKDYTTAQCAAKTANAGCMQGIVAEAKRDVAAHAKALAMFPLCDEDSLYGWCPCNLSADSAFPPNWIQATAANDEGGFTILAHPLLIPAGKTSTFSGSCGYEGGSYRIDWDFGDGSSASGGLVNHLFGPTGQHYVQAKCVNLNNGAIMNAAVTAVSY